MAQKQNPRRNNFLVQSPKATPANNGMTS